MKSKMGFSTATAVILMLVTAIVAITFDVAAATDQPVVVPALLRNYESGEREFSEVTIGDNLVYYHQRVIGDAIVEKDFVVYQFDSKAEELLGKRSHWRDDLAEQLPSGLISRQQAESLVEGEVLSSSLYYISPESDVYPLDPTPQNPCWVVQSMNEYGSLIVTIIDALDGQVLGYGVPPPYEGFSMSGPCYFEPCEWSWDLWYQNAEAWFEAMGYGTQALLWPTHAEIQAHVSSNETAVFYEIAHSGEVPTRFCSGCVDGQFREYTYWYDIEAWIADYPKMPFTFTASCYSMCDTSYGNLSHAFRKGSTEGTVTIGYCDMGEEYCLTCWEYSLDFQDMLFSYMSQGFPVKAAFDSACVAYPSCADNGCILFAGDKDLTVIPRINRDGSPVVLCGDADYSGTVDIDDVVYLIAFIFNDGPEPVPHVCAGDANGSGESWPVDIDDVVYLIDYIFSGGLPPVDYCCDYR